ncbi:MAG: hypothetical protein MUC95_02910, partial [Spirochaetes bacterium]|nr:hypothetical protein [Spirochaetota bacterium]
VARSEFQAEKIIGFAKQLVLKEEYYRAYVELERCRSYYPLYLTDSAYHISEIYLLFRGKRYDEMMAKTALKEKGNIGRLDSVFAADAYLNLSQFDRALSLIEPAAGYAAESDNRLFLKKRLFLSYIFLKRIDKAGKLIEDDKERGADTAGFKDAIGYTRDYFDTEKNPYSAAALGMIPGLGYVYSGQKETGIAAFLVVSIFSALTYYSFKTDNAPLGVFFGAAGTFFYAGNILGGYMASKKYNAAALENLKDYLFNSMKLGQDRDDIYNKYGIGNAR